LPQLNASPVQVKRALLPQRGQSPSPAQLQRRLLGGGGGEAAAAAKAPPPPPHAAGAQDDRGRRNELRPTPPNGSVVQLALPLNGGGGEPRQRYQVGQRVTVKFSANGGTYPATVVAASTGGGGGGGSYDVLYEDGQVDRAVPPHQIAAQHALALRQLAAPQKPVAGAPRYPPPEPRDGGGGNDGGGNDGGDGGDGGGGGNGSDGGDGNGGNGGGGSGTVRSGYSKGHIIEGLLGAGEAAEWRPAKVSVHTGASLFPSRRQRASARWSKTSAAARWWCSSWVPPTRCCCRRTGCGPTPWPPAGSSAPRGSSNSNLRNSRR
jgi:hypothetical protein